MTSSGVLMENTLVSHRVDNRLSCQVQCLSSSFVAGENSLANVFDSCAVARTLSREMLVASNCLNSALASLLRICHCFFSLPLRVASLLTLPVATSKTSGSAGLVNQKNRKQDHATLSHESAELYENSSVFSTDFAAHESSRLIQFVFPETI